MKEPDEGGKDAYMKAADNTDLEEKAVRDNGN